MKVNLIIGAGQLGSRHLQGLLKYSESQDIYVLDPSLESLKLAEGRSLEIENNHQVIFTQKWMDLPSTFDLAIVATNSDVREEVVKYLITNYTVKNLILEKVLFQEIGAYERIGEILKHYKVPTWVNHPRRMFDSYKWVKSFFRTSERKIIQITGGNWGLGCNALHFLDLIVYLTDNELVKINADLLNNSIIESKRKGFIEFTGSITGMLNDGSSFKITSLEGDSSAVTITIFDSSTRLIVQETGTPQMLILKKSNAFDLELLPFKMEYQSSLTTKLAEDIFRKKECDLPTYDLSARAHILFIREILRKYNEIIGLNQVKLPVT